MFEPFKTLARKPVGASPAPGPTQGAPASNASQQPAKARPGATIAQAFESDLLFGKWFAGPSWQGWRTILRATQGQPLAESERAFFASVAGDRAPPNKPVKEMWVVAGRRSGKDSVASGVAAHMAGSFQSNGILRPGERATVACLAVDRAQAAILHKYIRGYFTELPALKAMVRREVTDGLELKNGVDIVVTTSDYRAVRGRSYLLAVLDEVAFWRDSETSLNPDREIFRSLAPGMVTLPQSLLIGITSPFKRSGLAYDRWQRYFGKDDDRVLVVHCPSVALNPTLAESEIAAAMADDPLAARSDFLAEWRDDLAGYIPRDLLERCVERGVMVRPYERGRRYYAFLDAAEGLSANGDSFAAAIAHAQRDRDTDLLVLDWLQEWKPPFNPADIVRAVAGVLDEFHLAEVTADAHAAGFVTAELSKAGKKLVACDLDKSSLYLELLPRLSAGRVRLVDSDRVISQFCALERRALSGGHDRVDHARGGRDDLANAVAGALWCASRRRSLTFISPNLKAWAAIPQRGAYGRLDGAPAWPCPRPARGATPVSSQARSDPVPPVPVPPLYGRQSVCFSEFYSDAKPN
jgi:hypothetical protein